MAVAVGRYIDHQADVEMGTSLQDGFRILGDLAVQDIVGLVACWQDGVFRTDADAASAADAFVVVDGSGLLWKVDGAVGADLGAFLQLMQSSGSTWGFPALCISIFPAREPQPMPIFLKRPQIRMPHGL